MTLLKQTSLSGEAFSTAFNAFGYNTRNELTSSERYSGPFTENPDTDDEVLGQRRYYAFDPIGNRQGATEGSSSSTYETNELNQYTEAGDISSLSYDLDGNMTVKGDKAYGYDAENRLVSVGPIAPSEGDTRVTFVYDYMNRRVKKTVSTYTGGAWTSVSDTLFVWDGWNVVEEVKDGVSKHYVWGLDLSGSLQGAGGVGGLIAAIDESGQARYFAFDGNGNVGQLIAEDGTIVARYEYDPFGQTIVAEGAEAAENPYRFSTKYWDVDAELLFYERRPYDPPLGRWPTRDPIEERGGLNLYGFVGNRPIDSFDIIGLYRGEDIYCRCTEEQGKVNSWKKVNVAIRVLFGARPKWRHRLLRANRIFKQCCIKVERSGDVIEFGEAATKVYLGNDLIWDYTRNGETDEREIEQLAQYNAGEPIITAFYVKALYVVTRGDTGYHFKSTSPWGPSFLVANNGDRNTFSHELGHVLGLEHDDPGVTTDHLMWNYERWLKRKITKEQCDTCRENNLVQ